MERKMPVDDETAASSVVGIILLVAVTVILAAVLAVIALDIGESTQSAPSGDFTSSQTEKRLIATGGNQADFRVLEITYTGGQTLDEEQIQVRVNGERAYGVENTTGGSCSDPMCHEATGLWTGSDDITAGQRITVVHRDDATVGVGDRYSICSEPNDCPGSAQEIAENSRLWADGEATGGPQLELDEGDTVTVVWEAEETDDTALLLEETIE